MSDSFFVDPKPFLESAVQILLAQENYKALNVLAEGVVELKKLSEYSDSRQDETGWNSYIRVLNYRLEISLQMPVYQQVAKERDEIEAQIFSALSDSLLGYEFESEEGELHFGSVLIKIKHGSGNDWQDKAKATLAGSGLTNQGRVRSDSIAPIVHQGLLFRSPPEAKLFDALKRANLLFAPLPVFIRSASGNRIEPDFIIISEGTTLLVEVDGSTYHTETPLAAQERLEEFTDAGVQHIRVAASDCMNDADADKVAQKVKERLERIRSLR
ncbi:hypothetical protein DESA109040_03970 [Deinococcus saxicola]|uniref:hypothetical protein n=1 Tax=Deinococcus saxicola TaxID=249406 RepID=UPI0039F0BF27